MLVPLFLGICAVGADAGHKAAETLMQNNLLIALVVASLHTFTMTLAGAVVAVTIYLWLGLKFLSKTWFNLDLVWASSLVAVGGFGIYSAVGGH